MRGRELHPAFPLCSSLLPITPLLEANLMFPAEHHESAGSRPIILWLFVIMTLGRTEKKNLKWIKKVCMPGLYAAYVHCLASVSGVNNMFLLSSLVSLIILSLYLSPNP